RPRPPRRPHRAASGRVGPRPVGNIAEACHILRKISSNGKYPGGKATRPATRPPRRPWRGDRVPEPAAGKGRADGRRQGDGDGPHRLTPHRLTPHRLTMARAWARSAAWAETGNDDAARVPPSGAS